MAAVSPSSTPNLQPKRSALKTDSDGEKAPGTQASSKSVQLAEPESPEAEDPLQRKQFTASLGAHARRLGGRLSVPNMSPRMMALNTLGSSLGSVEAPGSVTLLTPSPLASGEHDHGEGVHLQPPRHRHKADRAVSERLLAQLAEWIEHEKEKMARRIARKVLPRRKSRSPPKGVNGEDHQKAAASEPSRARACSVESQSSEVSLDGLQKILEQSMVDLGLPSLPRPSPRLSRRPSHLKKLHRNPSHPSLTRTVSSDTEYQDGDVLVPSCDAMLDNSKALSYTAGASAAVTPVSDDARSVSGRKEERERQAWLQFKNEIIRLAHTLRLKGWRRVPLNGGDSVTVQRLSGALTNAVYVVSPPPESALAPAPAPAPPLSSRSFTDHAHATSALSATNPTPAHRQQPSKRTPMKVLLRVYGPQVEHLIDRENELGVLRRLARKKIGPRLLGTFVNGRFEQFFNATALTPDYLRDPDTSKKIAKRMRELHDAVDLLTEEKDEGPVVWKNWDRWLDQAEKTVMYLDEQVKSSASRMTTGPGSVAGDDAWKGRGYICGVEWRVFRETVDKYRRFLSNHYGGGRGLREQLIFAHNDTQYGNILRVQPDDHKSPLLQPANEHKQLIVIDFEYAGANTRGYEFANHFTEWTYNYHDPVRSHACNTALYPTLDQQRRFVKAYVDHCPKPYDPWRESRNGASGYEGGRATPAPTTTSSMPTSPAATPPANPGPVGNLVMTPVVTPGSGDVKPAAASAGGSTYSGNYNLPSSSASSICEFMLDSRAQPPGGWREEDARREEETERRVQELLDETKVWRPANSAQWIVWGVVQAKIPGGPMSGLADDTGSPEDEEGGKVEERASKGRAEDEEGADTSESESFDYLAFAQDRAYFFWGDCVLMGLVKAEDLPEELRTRIKMVPY